MRIACSLAGALDRDAHLDPFGLAGPVNRRTAKVAAMLVVFGAGAGALCGALAVIPLAIQHAFWPTRDDGLVGSAASWLPITMSVGATIGGVIGPALSLTLLRAIPLWRILLTATGAAIAGIFASWLLVRVTFLPNTLTAFSPLWLPTAAAVVAAIWLRRSSRSKAHEPLPLVSATKS